MPTYVALLRGINVGGHKQVAMADLRELISGLGFEDVRSLLNSGNLVFRSGSKSGAALERLLEAESRKRLGLETAYFVRNAVEWTALVAKNPFRAEAQRDPGRLVALLLKDAPSPAAVRALQSAISGPETVRAEDRQAYVFYPDGTGRSQLTINLIERKLGTQATGRNWNTVLKLAAAADA